MWPAASPAPNPAVARTIAQPGSLALDATGNPSASTVAQGAIDKAFFGFRLTHSGPPATVTSITATRAGTLANGNLLQLRLFEDTDADGQLDFAGIQALVARTVVESGECLVRFRLRRPGDGLAIPLQLQVLEPDFLDHTKTQKTDTGYII
ncbi:MAG: phage portal protein, partial [Bdellovibrionaceae bacterium]|nr:phage portal protein [Pseudobdellovibrionaceae bacterium]